MRNAQNESRIVLLCDNHVVMKFLENLFPWWNELVNSLRLLRLHSYYKELFTQGEVILFTTIFPT